MACPCDKPGASRLGNGATSQARPITLSGLSVGTGGFEFNVPPLPDLSWAGWGLVLKSDQQEATLSLTRRFYVYEGGGGLSSPQLDLYVDGEFFRLGIAASAFNATFKPQSAALTNFLAYPLTGEQLKTWPRFAWVRTELEVAENAEVTHELQPSTVDWVVKFDPEDVWTVSVQGRTGGNWQTETKLTNLTTGTSAWQFSGGLVAAQPPSRLAVTHDKAGTIAAVIYEKVAL